MESRPHGLPLLAEQSAARDHSQHETTRRGTARGPGNGSRHSRRRTLAEARFLVQELRLQADLPGTRRVFERPGILLTVFFRLKAKRRRSSESKESLFVPLRSRNCSSLLAIHSVDPRERVAPRLAHPAAFCQPHQRLLGLDVLVSSVVVVGFIRTEGHRLGVRRLWLPILGLFTVGVSCALPLFLYLREGALEGREAPAKI